MEDKIEKAIKKIVGKSVKITLSGIVESKFYMKSLKYEIEEGVLSIEDGQDSYIDVDIDEVENLYSEFRSNGYALIVLRVGEDLQIGIQTKQNDAIALRNKICKYLEQSEIAEEFYNEVCGV